MSNSRPAIGLDTVYAATSYVLAAGIATNMVSIAIALRGATQLVEEAGNPRVHMHIESAAKTGLLDNCDGEQRVPKYCPDQASANTVVVQFSVGDMCDQVKAQAWLVAVQEH